MSRNNNNNNKRKIQREYLTVLCTIHRYVVLFPLTASIEKQNHTNLLSLLLLFKYKNLRNTGYPI